MSNTIPNYWLSMPTIPNKLQHLIQHCNTAFLGLDGEESRGLTSFAREKKSQPIIWWGLGRIQSEAFLPHLVYIIQAPPKPKCFPNAAYVHHPSMTEFLIKITQAYGKCWSIINRPLSPKFIGWWVMDCVFGR
eukprot:TRINITY_DN49999_c0_g1_i1.p1 TRINITY_DN49999_c0_g1~~TRINITY_DN49999_c0_g1_i1.p1  ORF type:complete len:133 (-),score=12.02 TRINITY_DN49999_c0_g1_i1:171-569(-)